jgi:hypothetical protein
MGTRGHLTHLLYWTKRGKTCNEAPEAETNKEQSDNTPQAWPSGGAEISPSKPFTAERLDVEHLW